MWAPTWRCTQSRMAATMETGLRNTVANFSSRATENYWLERVDFRISDKDSFYARYVFDPSQSVSPEALPIFQTPIALTQHLVVLSETHILSSASLNEFRFAFNRTTPSQDSLPAIQIDPALSFVPGAALWIDHVFSVGCTNIAALGPGNQHGREAIRGAESFPGNGHLYQGPGRALAEIRS